MLVLGLDLAATGHTPTGLCILDTASMKAVTKVVYTNRQIIYEARKAKPNIISIDAPLSLPLGRRSIGDKSGPHFRKCDIELRKMHIRFFPITIGAMRKLTSRGMMLKKRFEKEGYEVIESFPGGAQDLLHIPRKQKGIEKLRRGLKRLGIKGIGNDASDDELDAVTCAYVGKCYLDGNYIALGDRKEGLLIMPEPL